MRWAYINGFEGLYIVSDQGQVMSLPRSGSGGREYEKILSGGICSGYLALTLCNKGKSKRVQIHRMVAEAFLPNIEGKLQVNHINGVKTDNRLENLEWVTPSENILHGLSLGIMNTAKGEQKKNSKFKNSEVSEIKIMLREGVLGTVIANKFGVHKSIIYSIKSGKTWKHVQV